MIRHILAGAVAFAFICSPAHAQSAQSAPAGPFLFGGWSLELRDEVALNGASVGAGLPLTKTLSVEGSVGWYEALSRNSSLNTPFGRRDIRTTDRNVPVAGSVRWSMACARQVCADLIGGAGVNFRQLTIRTLATCPPSGTLGPCVESDHVEETNQAEFLLTGGIDIRIRLMNRLALVPGFRISAPARTVLLRAGDGSSDIPYVLMNVTAFYRFR